MKGKQDKSCEAALRRKITEHRREMGALQAVAREFCLDIVKLGAKLSAMEERYDEMQSGAR